MMKNLILTTVSLVCMLAASAAVSGPAFAAAVDITVSGTVTDETGLPLAGLTVYVSGTDNGTLTDLDGHYTIEVPEDAVLVFSYLGYRTQEIPVGGRAVIDIQLFPDTEVLADAVVIGYGTTTRRDMTGSILSGHWAKQKPDEDFFRRLMEKGEDHILTGAAHKRKGLRSPDNLLRRFPDKRKHDTYPWRSLT